MRKLKIRTETMFGSNHSWAITLQELMREFAEMGHDLYIKSTDGYPTIDHGLSKFYNLDCENADIDICYTLPGNWKNRFKKNSKLKASIFNYESSIVPKEWLFDLQHLDFVFPSSNYSYQVLSENNWDKNKLKVIPLGINPSLYGKEYDYKIKTNKSFKFLNVSINHHRKNIDKLLTAYYQEFSDKDDVVLILKTNLNKPKTRFECDVGEIILNVQKSIKNKILPQLIIVNEKLDNMAKLYANANCLISTSSAEGFGLPFLEAMASNLIVIAPGATGQMDFLNKQNSLLLNMNYVKANPDRQYWRASEDGMTYMPDVDDIRKNMRLAYENHIDLKKVFLEKYSNILSEYTWNNSAKKIIEIYDSI